MYTVEYKMLITKRSLQNKNLSYYYCRYFSRCKDLTSDVKKIEIEDIPVKYTSFTNKKTTLNQFEIIIHQFII